MDFSLENFANEISNGVWGKNPKQVSNGDLLLEL